MKTKLFKGLILTFLLCIVFFAVSCTTDGSSEESQTESESLTETVLESESKGESSVEESEKDHVCEYNQLKYDETQHWNECFCGEKDCVSAHEGGSSTCQELAVCSICGQRYGSYGEHNIVDDECSVCGESQGLYTIDGTYIYFGEYPQSLKEENVTITEETNEKGYYKGSDGKWYAKVVATPYESGYKFDNGTSVDTGATYYFKVEPIKWVILESDDETAFILCASIIDNKRYDDDSNNYANSEIRAWLNNQFYNTAFNEMQQAIILTTVVNNGEYSTESSLNPYVCENTNDKIFLLSYKEAQNLKYFSSSSKRERVTSDYTRAMGISITTMEEFYGRAFWKLRSPSKDFNSSVNYVHFYGYVYYYSGVDNDNVGVVPALKIRL